MNFLISLYLRKILFSLLSVYCTLLFFLLKVPTYWKSILLWLVWTPFAKVYFFLRDAGSNQSCCNSSLICCQHIASEPTIPFSIPILPITVIKILSSLFFCSSNQHSFIWFHYFRGMPGLNPGLLQNSHWQVKTTSHACSNGVFVLKKQRAEKLTQFDTATLREDLLQCFAYFSFKGMLSFTF